LVKDEVSEYYRYHAEEAEPALATHSEIISSNVVVFRDDQYEFLDSPFVGAFITSAAPEAITYYHSLGHGPKQVKVIHDVMYGRIERIILSAISRRFKSIILGAYGCGAFRNDPRDTAQIFREFLVDRGLRTYFEKVTFAIFDLSQQNWPVFAEIFGPGD
jgi:uncharacterized protein (TIGR02452 family)